MSVKTIRDAEKTIGNMIDKQSICYISSIDKEGFPNTKAMLKGIVEVLEDKESEEMIEQAIKLKITCPL